MSAMAEAQGEKVSSLAEQYLLPEKEEKPAEVKVAEPVKAVTEEVTEEAKESSDSVAEVASSAVEAVSDSTASYDSTENTEQVAAGDAAPASDESKGTNEEENSSTEEATEETPEIKLETAPADFRFPTTNQTRHCFTRYIEYHRCVAAKGEDAQECQKFARYYRALCPGEWVDKWNEQIENGTFPGPL